MDVRDNSNPKLHIRTLHTVYCHELELARESGTPAAVENATDDVTGSSPRPLDTSGHMTFLSWTFPFWTGSVVLDNPRSNRLGNNRRRCVTPYASDLKRSESTVQDDIQSAFVLFEWMPGRKLLPLGDFEGSSQIRLLAPIEIVGFWACYW